jgi:hypothetical protein
MNLSTEFWNAYNGVVVVATDGAIGFTRMGRTRYAPLFARYGFAIDQIKTLTRFLELTTYVNQQGYESNTRALKRALSHPATSEVERDLIRRALSIDFPD